MRPKALASAFAASLLGCAQAQECTDIGLLESIANCVATIPTYTLSYTDSAAAVTFGCTFEKAVLSCYSSFCPGATPHGVSEALLASSEFCDGVTASTQSGTAAATATVNSGDTSTTVPAGSESSPTGASPTTAAAVGSQTSQAEAPKRHTLLVQKVVVVAAAGLVGGMVV